MRLLLDVQAAQTRQSAGRGIGRYTLGLTEAMLREAGSHEIWLAASSRWPEGLLALRRRFAGLLPPERFRAWQVPAGVAAWPPGPAWRPRAAEALREQFLAGLGADIVHVSGVQEGFDEDAVSSIGLLAGGPPVGCVLPDLTPAVQATEVLSHPQVRQWYQAKLRDYGRARRWLAISENTRREAIELLGLPPADVVNISAGVDPAFRPGVADAAGLPARFGLTRPFVLCYGGTSAYKNIDRLLEAFARLPAALRAAHQLVLAGPVAALDLARLEATAHRVGLAAEEWPRLGFVPDAELVPLLQACALFVYPSLREGFGLPLLEAMACGAPALCGDRSSLPEVIGRADAMFNPLDAGAMAALMQRALEDAGFRASLRAHGLERARRFTWQASARAALATYEGLAAEEQDRARQHRAVPVALPHRPRLAWVADWPLPAGRAALLRQLAGHYDIDLILDPPASAAAVHHGVPVLAADQALGQLARYDRVVLERAEPGPWLARHPALLVGAAQPVPAGALGCFNPDACAAAAAAAQMQHAIERSHAGAASPLALARTLARMLPATGAEAFEAEVVQAMAANTAPGGPPRLLLDITVQARRQHGSGIARVVDRIMGQLLANPPAGLQVELVRGLDGQLRHARRFQALLDGWPEAEAESLAEPAVEPRPGDHYLGLDLHHDMARHAGFFHRLHAAGGQASAVVYDLLPLQRPDWFPPGMADAHGEWFAQCARLDRLVCISAAVAADVAAALPGLAIGGTLPQVGWFHLAGDLPAAAEPGGAPVAELAGRPSIMLVSVLWARKGQEQTLDAFERLWAAGVSVNLVFVGRVGWGVDGLVERLRHHPERNHRLFWYDGPDDALLARLYATVDGVLVASEGEGFGLPLVEAAHYHRPVLARDLPVFREIMGDQVRYFEGLAAADLATAVQAWLAELAAGTAPRAKAAMLPDWATSCRQLLVALDLRASA